MSPFRRPRTLLIIPVALVLSGLLALSSQGGSPGETPPAPPRLAVLVVFDQMRADYLVRWQDLFGDDGFRRLAREGAWFQNCHYPYANTVTAAGHSSQASSGIAMTLLVFIVVAGLAWIASGLARLRPWSRTPAVLTQVLAGVIGVYLLQAHRFDWGVPALLLALAGLAGLLAPPSLRALNRPGAPPAKETAATAKPKPQRSAAGGSGPRRPPVNRR